MQINKNCELKAFMCFVSVQLLWKFIWKQTCEYRV